MASPNPAFPSRNRNSFISPTPSLPPQNQYPSPNSIHQQPPIPSRASISQPPLSRPPVVLSTTTIPTANNNNIPRDDYFELEPEQSNSDSYFELEPEAPSSSGSPELEAFLNTSVGYWLVKIGLTQYAETMLENGYDDAGVVKAMTESDFEDIGITNAIHRGTLLSKLHLL